MNSTKLLSLAGCVLLLNLAFLFKLPAAEDLSSQLTAVEQTQPTPASEIPKSGLFYSAKLAGEGMDAPLYPGAVGLNAWNLGNGAWLVDDLNPVVPVRNGLLALDDSGVPPPPGAGTNGYSGTNTYVFTPTPIDTNLLWLSLSNIQAGVVNLQLHRGSNAVYGIYEASAITTPFSEWTPVAELWPTNDTTNMLPFTVSAGGGATEFYRAMDWSHYEIGNLPASWVYFWYGNLLETATNLDASGQTLLADYEAQIEPNIISFWIRATNRYVPTMNAPVQLVISGGVPSYIAISVDDSNYLNDASWQNYTTSNLNVNLGLTPGWHDVFVGLKGYATNATATWQEQRLKLDYTPPVLVITNPTVGTVAVPLIQLQGYSLETLSHISYDESNALGVVTNQPGQLLAGQFFDTNAWEYTTDYFQCYDLALATNANSITVRATDLAGNVTTTNFNITLDYATATNPVIQLTCPYAGAQICGSSFTIRGWVDDATASVQAMITDTNGDTNLITGVVERNGKLWAENLPLNEGTNAVTLWVTNAAGLGSVTNFNVSKSDMILSVTNIDGDLWLPTVKVSGLISDPTAPVWVNGVQGVNNGDGTWSASNVPVSSGGVASFDVSTDPTNAPDPITTVNTNKTTEVSVDSMQSTESGATSGIWNYSAGSGGTAHYVEDYYSDTQVVTTDIQYAPDLSLIWEQDSYQFADNPAGDYTTETTNGASAYVYNVEGADVLDDVVCTYQQVMALRVGGKSEPDQKELAAVTAGASVVVTPTTAAAPYYDFLDVNGQDSLQAGINTVSIGADQYDLSTTNPQFCVGQQVSFLPRWRQGTPPITTASAFKWVLPSKYVNESYPYSSTCTSYRQNPDLLTNELTSCWFVDGSGGEVNLAMNLQFANGQQAVVTAKGNISIFRPRIDGHEFISSGVVELDTNNLSDIRLGMFHNSDYIHWTTEVEMKTNFPGTLSYTQLVDWESSYDVGLYCVSKEDSTDSQYWLENTANATDIHDPNGPYFSAMQGITFADGPDVSGNFCTFAQLTPAFKTYLQFQPDGGIPITLEHTEWTEYGRADSNGVMWNLTTHYVDGPHFYDDDSFPIWLQVFTNND